MRTPKQVAATRGQGLPFTRHFGMLMDKYPFGAVMAYIVAAHHERWTGLSFGYALLVGFMLSSFMHAFYIQGGKALPEAHTHDGKLTLAGWLHFVYMGVALAVIGLFYWYPRGVLETILIGVFLVVHVIVGTHVPFRAWVKKHRPAWYPVKPIIALPDAATIAGAAVLVTGLSFL